MGRLRGQRITYGVKALTNLEIDVDKDWAGKKIMNLGEPTNDNDAARNIEVKNLRANIIASDTIVHDNSVDKTQNALVYTKTKEIKIKRAYAGSYRIKFEISCSGAGGDVNGYAKIYKNGVVVGTERTHNNGDPYTSFSEDFVDDLEKDDLIQIYCKTSDGSWPVHCKSFKVCFDEKDFENQDP